MTFEFIFTHVGEGASATPGGFRRGRHCGYTAWRGALPEYVGGIFGFVVFEGDLAALRDRERLDLADVFRVVPLDVPARPFLEVAVFGDFELHFGRCGRAGSERGHDRDGSSEHGRYG